MKNNKFEVTFKTVCKLIGYVAIAYYVGVKVGQALESVTQKFYDRFVVKEPENTVIEVKLEDAEAKSVEVDKDLPAEPISCHNESLDKYLARVNKLNIGVDTITSNRIASILYNTKYYYHKIRTISSNTINPRFLKFVENLTCMSFEDACASHCIVCEDGIIRSANEVIFGYIELSVPSPVPLNEDEDQYI